MQHSGSFLNKKGGKKKRKKARSGTSVLGSLGGKCKRSRVGKLTNSVHGAAPSSVKHDGKVQKWGNDGHVQ